MKQLTFILFISLFSFCTTTNNLSLLQDIDDVEFIIYDKKQASIDFDYARKLENYDSLDKAIKFYKRVVKFGEISKNREVSENKLDSIRQIERKVFLEKLQGKWRWIWSGTNWGTQDSPKTCNCEKYLKITEKNIELIQNDKKPIILNYEFIDDINLIGSEYFLIKVENNQTKEKWKLKIYQQIDNHIYLSERSENSDLFLEFIDITEYRYCVCGCSERRFEKIII